MSSKRSLLIGAVATAKGRIRHDGKAMVSICNELEPCFALHKYLQNAPFKCINLVIRYGNNSSEGLDYCRIDCSISELQVTYVVPIRSLQRLDYNSLRLRLRQVTLDALVAVAKKFDLPADVWEHMRESSSNP